jgi:hypothetical protein
VDISPISFSDLFPDVGPHGQSLLEFGANVTDGDQGSGVLLSSIDYRIFTNGEWSEWKSAGMPGISNHNRFSVKDTFADGENNRIQFRGSDVAGNGPSMSEEHYLTVDTTGPEFGVVTPGSDDKQPGTMVTVKIIVSDAIVGVNGSAVKYAFGTEGKLGEWMTAPTGPSGGAGQGTYLVEVEIEFAPGVDNVVAFQAFDRLDNGMTSETFTIWVNRAPNAFIKSPVSTEIYMENDPVTLNGTLSSDPDEDDLNYTWYSDMQVDPIGYGKLLDVDLPVGTYNVTLVVTDDVGDTDELSVLITVDEYIPPTTETSSVIWWVLLIVILAAIGGAIFWMTKRKDAMDEWEEV